MTIGETFILLIPVFFLMALSIWLGRGNIKHNLGVIWREIRGDK